MEPWSEEFRRSQEKGVGQKCLEAAVLVYAGFAIFVVATLAETVTIPLAAHRRKKREKNSNHPYTSWMWEVIQTGSRMKSMLC